MPDRARALTLTDLADPRADVRFRAHEPRALYEAVDALVQEIMGHLLLTIMRVHEATMEVERVYSSNVAAYPVGGRKTKRGTPWSKVVLDRGEVFVARTPDEVRAAVRRLRIDIQPRRRIDHEHSDRLSRTAIGHHEHLERGRLVSRPGCGRRVADRAAAGAGA